MKLPPGLEPSDNGEVILSAAEVGELGRRIHGLIAQRDHARAWAAFHHADAARERERLDRLAKDRGLSRDRVAHLVGKELPAPPADLACFATDRWDGLNGAWDTQRWPSPEGLPG